MAAASLGPSRKLNIITRRLTDYKVAYHFTVSFLLSFFVLVYSVSPVSKAFTFSFEEAMKGMAGELYRIPYCLFKEFSVVLYHFWKDYR